jgi:molybdate transport system ATP-binding protein
MLSVDINARKGRFLLQPRFEVGDELAVLIGASGAGKSLTLKSIAGLLTPERGRIALPDGTVAFDAEAGVAVPPQRRGVGYVVQDLALFPHLTVRQNIEFALHGRPRDEIARRTGELLALLGLEETAGRRPREISGGQQQRVALARALAGEPRLLLLDEPFSALDSELRAALRRELVSLQRRLGLTVLFVTHDINDAYTMADRIVVFDDGRVVQTGGRDDVFYRPATYEAAKLVGVRNFVPGRVVEVNGGEAAVRTLWFTVRAPAAGHRAGDAVFACIRPEHAIVLREGSRAHDPRDVTLEAAVVHDTQHPLLHSLVFEARGGDPAGARLTLEIDLPSHSYAVLNMAAEGCRSIVLPFGSVFLVSRDGG